MHSTPVSAASTKKNKKLSDALHLNSCQARTACHPPYGEMTGKDSPPKTPRTNKTAKVLVLRSTEL